MEHCFYLIHPVAEDNLPEISDRVFVFFFSLDEVGFAGDGWQK